VKKRLAAENGFTVLELIIAVQLTLLVIGMAYSSFLFAQRLYIKWQQKTAAEQQYKLANEMVSVRLSQLSRITNAKPYLLEGVTLKNLPITIKLHEPFLQNGSPKSDGVYARFLYRVRDKSVWEEEVTSEEQGSTIPIVAVMVEGKIYTYGQVWPLRIVQRLVSREPIIR